jgi:hypothetical protein
MVKQAVLIVDWNTVRVKDPKLALACGYDDAGVIP